MAFKQITISLLFLAVFLNVTWLNAQVEEEDFMYLVQVDVKEASEIALIYTTRFDIKKVQITYAFEDTINSLMDFIYEEDPLVGPECFVPELKLIYRDYTYVFSIHCSKVIKFANTAPHVPSSRRLKNDLIVTQGMLDYLTDLRTSHFGAKLPSQGLLAKVITSEPFDEMNSEDDALNILFEEDTKDDEDEDDLELEEADEMILEDESDLDLLDLEDEGLEFEDDGK